MSNFTCRTCHNVCGKKARQLNEATFRRSPVGFTLVELLVVITIIGIIMALAMPAVMSSRESARRVACLHNLTRIGMALARYEAAQESLPSGTVAAEGPVRNAPEGYKMSWLTQVLPYIDERNLYEHIDFSVGAYDAKNARARAINVPTFVCPSCGVCRISASGSGTDDQWSCSHEIRSEPDSWTASNYAGCQDSVEATIDVDNDGVLFLNSRIGRDDLVDGASHTIFVGEKLIGYRDLGWMSGTRATLRNAGAPLNRTPGDSDTLTIDSKTETSVAGRILCRRGSAPAIQACVISSSATAVPTRSRRASTWTCCVSCATAATAN